MTIKEKLPIFASILLVFCAYSALISNFIGNFCNQAFMCISLLLISLGVLLLPGRIWYHSFYFILFAMIFIYELTVGEFNSLSNLIWVTKFYYALLSIFFIFIIFAYKEYSLIIIVLGFLFFILS